MPSVLDRPCLHCVLDAQIASREHVLQEGLGGGLVLDQDVCLDCNTVKFSPLDTELTRFVRTHVYWNHPVASTGRSFLHEGIGHYPDPSGLWFSAWLDRKLSPFMFPQIVFVGVERGPDPGSQLLHSRIVFDVSQSDPASVVELFRRELAEPAKLKIKTVVVERPSEDLPDVQPALLRSGAYSYVARGGSQHDADEIVRLARSGELQPTISHQGPPPAPLSLTPVMHKVAEYDLGAVSRALVKTALNFLCAALGPDIARRPAFDDARTFACRSDGRRWTRFVRLLGAEADERLESLSKRVAQDGHHSLLLAEVAGVPIVLVVLYEQPFAFVQLSTSPVPEALPARSLTLGLFDYRTKRHRILRASDDPEGILRIDDPSRL